MWQPKKLLKIRELYGLSQADVAKSIGIPQPTYASYETGKTQQIPPDFMERFSYRYFVNLMWLRGAAIVEGSNLGQFHRDIETKIADRVPEVAERLRLPEAFIQALCNGEVVGSSELYNMIRREFGELFPAGSENSEKEICSESSNRDFEKHSQDSTKIAELKKDNAILENNVASLTQVLEAHKRSEGTLEKMCASYEKTIDILEKKVGALEEIIKTHKETSNNYNKIITLLKEMRR